MQVDEDLGSQEVNAALLCDYDDVGFFWEALARVNLDPGVLVISNDPQFALGITTAHRANVEAVGLENLLLDPEESLAEIRRYLTGLGALGAVIVDMDWLLVSAMGARSIDVWGEIAERLCARPNIAVISIYNKELLIEDQLRSAFRAHQQFLAPSGLYENPHWMPAEIAQASTLDEQLGFMLGRVVPDFAGSKLFRSFDRLAARGASPDWAAMKGRDDVQMPGDDRWFIACLGPLQVQRGDGQTVDWRVAGGAPKKIKTLFAYLFSSGDKGEHAEQICELLWPDLENEKTKRARLHHTVAMLRKALGSSEAVLRHEDFYRLNLPTGSWTDLAMFEQVCRRGLSLAREERNDAALKLYLEGERLYRGDLFADLPHEYTVVDGEDWVIPRRTWLREMAMRLQFDMSKLLRRYRRYGEALDHALKAVAIDPTSEPANIEAMRVFHAQGRTDAMHRQFRQYRLALSAMGETAIGPEIKAAYDELCRSLDRLTPSQRKTKELVLR